LGEATFSLRPCAEGPRSKNTCPKDSGGSAARKKAAVKERRRPAAEGFGQQSPLAKGFRHAQTLRDEDMAPRSLRPASEESTSQVDEESVGPLWDDGRVQAVIHDECKGVFRSFWQKFLKENLTNLEY